MKRTLFLLSLILFASAFILSACDKETEEVIVDSSLPSGNFSASRSGNIQEQNMTGSKGLVQLGKDSENTDFLRFGSDFTTNLATGTVTVYLSTSQNFVADPANGNPNLRLIGVVAKNGEQYFKLNSQVESKFTHLILWCGSANIPFGFAPIQ